MSFAMEKVEKRLTDLSGALAHNYPEIKLHFILQTASALTVNYPVTDFSKLRDSLAALMRLE
ncbi:hypothetical protein DUQ00_10640 [Salmonella bongori]|uniref:Uncharacterized protein n=2 Tax=Salmonella TaxID=590 RepID=A0A750KMZ3_SALER|nr:hypothetical protein [Salmonella bongori]ECG8258111.1 hypothetical protein [Salmonella bongori serovar 48:i:-]EGE4653837.1 hypothetical protein [Salmonella bongori serovar 40:z35:- str. 95-0123]EGE4658608.1 hypothetical protein [Salmonella bongori serovar 48:i:- str. 94-0708]EGS1129421.1 hypothetical protein [Salmonella bongori CFSAN000509]HAC6694701.1 hypothetical protein [Salmonella bongori serovar 44:r:-]